MPLCEVAFCMSFCNRPVIVTVVLSVETPCFLIDIHRKACMEARGVKLSIYLVVQLGIYIQYSSILSDGDTFLNVHKLLFHNHNVH